MLQEIQNQLKIALQELLSAAKLKELDLVIVGCSSSEIAGKRIGSSGSEEIGKAVFDALYPILNEKGLFLAAQCCEHLNRALIIEEDAARLYGLETVNVVPHPHAGGSFATAVYKGLPKPVAVERIRAAAGIDIGDTLIGMHLRPVAVPLRSSINKIGEANLVLARTRPRFIGGERAKYDTDLL